MRIAVSRSSNAERVVTPLELFFDLVYVFAIGQLSHHLLEHIDLQTGAETVILALAVFYAWYMTAWGASWLEPDRLPVQLLLVGLTLSVFLCLLRLLRHSVDGRGCSSLPTLEAILEGKPIKQAFDGYRIRNREWKQRILTAKDITDALFDEQQ
jgi:hypothetical protein